jgi:hypothetical protein
MRHQSTKYKYKHDISDSFKNGSWSLSDINERNAWSRWWDRYEGKVQFRDEKDYEWFVLKWGA